MVFFQINWEMTQNLKRISLTHSGVVETFAGLRSNMQGLRGGSIILRFLCFVVYLKFRSEKGLNSYILIVYDLSLKAVPLDDLWLAISTYTEDGR